MVSLRRNDNIHAVISRSMSLNRFIYKQRRLLSNVAFYSVSLLSVYVILKARKLCNFHHIRRKQDYVSCGPRVHVLFRTDCIEQPCTNTYAHYSPLQFPSKRTRYKRSNTLLRFWTIAANTSTIALILYNHPNSTAKHLAQCFICRIQHKIVVLH